ncbi:ATP-binding cassette subfamily B protein [Gracilibacillus halotolerans]|uniref:ATP-binding cassette subfamily B protein n=1 Tax=Gracilibacillus halotolerans TaxID=74386 RepID=A0A841RET1_9BACI|nr:ABC transporter ATP-binding protein [Gracilibacillus halotolerans]MBB6512540.1 ATP-binding cassette subfamily B protein [Gracilibacillus halotolerans]
MANRHGPRGTSGQKKPKVKNMRSTLRRMWSYLAINRIVFWVVLVLVIISSVLSLAGPYFLGVAVDTMLGEATSFTLFSILIILAIVFILQSVTLALSNYWMIDISQQTVFRMRKELFEHVLQLPVQRFQTSESGDLISRLTNDIENVSRTLNTAIIQVITSVITLVGTLLVMLWLSPLLTLLTITIVPLMYFGMKWITKRTGKYFKEQQKALGDMTGYLEEHLSGHTMIKLFHQENRAIRQYDTYNKELRDVGYWAQVYSGFIPKLMNSLNNLSFAIIVGIGGWIAITTNNATVSVGVIVAFSTYARQFTRPLNDLANQFNVILSAVAGAERAFEIMDEPIEEREKKEKLTSWQGDVMFKNVSFAYNESEKVLNNVSFHAKSGEMIALVGPTGAGKTTIISLLARFYEENQGNILLDGKHASHVSKESIRDHLGIVLQDSYLFDTTIRENIRYGRLDATDDEVEQAAALANAASFIQQLPDGYDTVLSGNGNGISQGQRQLLAIARVMLKNPDVLILDEATSSIDTVTEIKITEALGRLMNGKTSFVIAHRLNTVKEADKILVLNHGQIIEQGTHRELLTKKGFYANLVQTQQLNEGTVNS